MSDAPQPRPDRLKRARVPMPDDIRAELVQRDPLGAYRQRPAQMLSELNSGNAYMNMPYRAKTS